MSTELELNVGINSSGVVENLFYRGALAGDLNYYENLEWTTSVKIIDEKFLSGFKIYGSFTGTGLEQYFLIDDQPGSERVFPVFLFISLKSGGGFYARIAYGRKEDIEGMVDRLKTYFAPVCPKTEFSSKVNFWMLGENGPRSMTRYLDVFPYEKVVGNYDSETESLLKDKLIKFEPTRSGQLFILAGEPGTGKTNALRMLTWEWRKWATYHYILDPVEFFSRPTYLLEVIFEEAENDDFLSAPPVPSGVIVNGSEERKDKWKVVILEDVGGLLGANGTVDQSLRTLFNVSDGFIGQGFKLLFVITTNEEIKKLHEAVSRPGRCALSHQFKKLTPEDSKNWVSKNAKDKEIELEEGKDYSIAELYNLAENQVISRIKEKSKKRVGFTT